MKGIDMKDLIYLYDKYLVEAPHLDINKIFKENTLDECMIMLLNFKTPSKRKEIEEKYKIKENELER